MRSSRPADLLQAGRIRAELAAAVRRRVSRLEVFAELDSTNAHLLAAPPPVPGDLSAALAEFQTAGRGRRGRNWTVPFGRGICLSVGWTFAQAPTNLPALSLAVAVVTRRVIAAACGSAPVLKWPNDLLWNERKLGGILVEVVAQGSGACYAVVGLGLNVAMDSGQLEAVGGPLGAIDIGRMTGGRPPRRNTLAARLIEGYGGLFPTFGVAGFEPYRRSYLAADGLRHRQVQVTDGPVTVPGTAEGVDASGALILRTGSGLRRIVSGDVSVRPVA